MRSRQSKKIVCFKVDAKVADLLDALPNKSEFVRAAIEQRLALICPTCRGSGLLAWRGAGADGAETDAATGEGTLTEVERSRFAAESLAFGVISGASAQPASWRAGALIA